jgi:hypothetical protein
VQRLLRFVIDLPPAPEEAHPLKLKAQAEPESAERQQ